MQTGCVTCRHVHAPFIQLELIIREIRGLVVISENGDTTHDFENTGGIKFSSTHRSVMDTLMHTLNKIK